MKTKCIIIFTLPFLICASKISTAQKSITNAYYLSKVLVSLNDAAFSNDTIINKDPTTFKTIREFINSSNNRWDTTKTELKNKIDKVTYSNILNFVRSVELFLNNAKITVDLLKILIVQQTLELNNLKGDELRIEKKLSDFKDILKNEVNDSLSICSESSFASFESAKTVIKELEKIDSYFNTLLGTKTSFKICDINSFKNSLDSIIAIQEILNSIKGNMVKVGIGIKEASDKIQKLGALKNIDFSNIKYEEFTTNNAIYSKGNTVFVSIENSGSTSTLASSNTFKVPSESEIIDALAILVANRFQEELTLTFIDELKYQIRNQEEVKQLFPNTLSSLDNLKGYKLPTIGDDIFLALAQDILNLDATIINLKKLPVDVTTAIKLVNIFTHKLEKGQQFEGVIEIIDNEWMSDTTLFKKLIHTLRVINDNFRSYDGKSFYMRYTDIMEMETIQFDYFIALLANHEPLIRDFLINNGINLSSNEKDFNKIRNQLGNMLLALENFENSIKGFEGKERNVEVGQSLVNLFKEIDNVFHLSNPKTKDVMAVVEHMLEIFRYKMKGDYKPVVRHITSIIEIGFAQNSFLLSEVSPEVLQLYADMKVIYEENKDKSDHAIAIAMTMNAKELFKNYPAILNAEMAQDQERVKSEILKVWYVLHEVANAYQSFVRDPLATSFSLYKLKDTINKLQIINHNLTFLEEKKISNLLKTFFEEKNKQYKIIDKLSVVGSFATDILRTKNSSELAKVFEAYASPVNSYKIKRTTRHSLAVNAFVGAYGGIEYSAPYEKKGFNNFGITVPIGITYSWASRKNLTAIKTDNVKRGNGIFWGCNKQLKFLTGSAKSISFIVFDITAPFVFRFREGEDSKLPNDIKIQDVFAPGIIFSYHIRKHPICFNLGAQLAPRLVNIDNTANRSSLMRFNVGIAFDVPLLQISKKENFE